MSDEKKAMERIDNEKVKEILFTNELIGKYNKAIICGKIDSDVKFVYESYNEKFYSITVKVNRLSEKSDSISVLMSEKILNKNLNHQIGKWITIIGEFRSYKWQGEPKSSKVLFLFAKEFKVSEKETELLQTTNVVYLDGYLCKDPVYRITLSGKRISDIMLCVNKPHTGSDYIPCVVWNGVAEWVALNLKEGDRVTVYGRIQSREYLKRYSNEPTDYELKTIHEISVQKLDRYKSPKKEI